MASKDLINRQLQRVISDNSPTTLMGLRGLLRFNSISTWLVYLVIIAIVASWIPLAGAVRAKFVRNKKPRVHIFQDMDNQPRYEAQAPNPVFANGMAMRPLIPGTVKRGHLAEDDFYHRGFQVTGTNSDGSYQVEYFEGFPDQIEVTPEFLAKGKELWARYCYLCHGYDGYGNGPVHVRALQNIAQNPNWIPPSSMHDEVRRSRTNGHLYNTINNGIRSMAGYGAQITAPEDRWAVVAYIRALQLSQNAAPNAIPAQLRDSIPVQPSLMNARAIVTGEATEEGEAAQGGAPEGAGSQTQPAQTPQQTP